MRIKISLSVFILSLFVIVSCKDNRLEEVEKQLSKNNLNTASSPYLLQHAKNPVHWQSWEEPVLEVAQKKEKPLIISIGYAACHWCHVMEEESFEDREVADFMNDHFISIKVDREERPDVDQIYLKALEQSTGNGGWPLNAITLPDGKPVWLGTYQSKTEWLQVMKTTLKIISETPIQAKSIADNIQQGIIDSQPVITLKGKARFRKDEVESAVNRWRVYLDTENGGLDQKEKFPMPHNQQFLLRYAIQNEDKELLDYVNTTLMKMSQGGIYDVIGGGFSRYSVDSLWHVPHFEKMLYDNALLMSLYSDAYKATGNDHYRTIVEETATFIERDLSYNKGLFSSSLDADSYSASGLKEEGAFYVWQENELKDLLGEDFEFFKSIYNINETGLWEEGRYVLIQTQSDIQLAATFHADFEEFQKRKKSLLKKLKLAREQRAKPKIDDKVLTSWNALTAIGFIDAYEATTTSSYLDSARNIINALELNLQEDDLRLMHVYKDGKKSVDGHLLDYASLIKAYIKLYENTGDSDFLEKSEALTEVALEDFNHPESPLLYYTSSRDHSLIVKDTEIVDGVIPSSNALMAENLFLLSHYLGKKAYNERAKKMLQAVKSYALNSGAGHSKWLQVMNNYAGPFYEVAIIGDEALKITQELQLNYLPNVLIAQSTKQSEDYLLKNRFNNGKTLIYVCQDNTCKLPVSTVSEALILISK